MIETPLDWKIGKKLLDAGGLGPRVYIHLPRHMGRQHLLNEYCKYLLNQGRQVVIMRPQKPEGYQLQGMAYKYAFIDKDILSPESYARAERIWNAWWRDNNPMKVKGD